MDWTCGEEFWRAHYYDEGRDAAPAPDHGLYPACEQCEAAIADLERRGRLLCVACADDGDLHCDHDEGLCLVSLGWPCDARRPA